MAQENDDVVAQVFFIRGGKMIGRDHFFLHTAGEEKAVVLSSFIKQFYAGTAMIPKEIMIESEIEDRAIIEAWLSNRRGTKVQIRVPKKGTKEKNGSGRYTEVICDRIRSVYGCEGNSVTCKEKDDRTILSFMDVFVCINDSFRCTFKSISDEALCQYTRTDSDYNNCVRCSVGIMVYQYAGFYPEKKKSGACHAGFPAQSGK